VYLVEQDRNCNASGAPKFTSVWGVGYCLIFTFLSFSWDRYGRGRMVVEFATTYAISSYHLWCCEFESRSGRGVLHYVIKFVSDLRQFGGFLRILRFPPPIKTDRHDITEILLKVALNAMIKPNQTMIYRNWSLSSHIHSWWTFN